MKKKKKTLNKEIKYSIREDTTEGIPSKTVQHKLIEKKINYV